MLPYRARRVSKTDFRLNIVSVYESKGGKDQW